MKEEIQRLEEILNSKLKVIADRNERFAVIHRELEKLEVSVKVAVLEIHKKFRDSHLDNRNNGK